MPKINNTNKYPFDDNVTNDDFLLGSDNDNGKVTKSYKLSTLADYFTQYFNNQNTDVTLNGNVTGGNGTTIITTQAHPSIISDKPVVDTFNGNDSILYLTGTQLSQMKWSTIAEYIAENGGGYNPPTYTHVNLTGSGIQFIQSVQSNNLGAFISAQLGTIPDSTTTTKGVVRIATPSEYNSNLTNVALPPAAASGFLPNSSISGGVNFLPKFTSSNTIGNSVVKEESGNVGIDVNPDISYKLKVNGNIQASGFVTPLNSAESVLTTNGGSAVFNADIDINSGEISIVPFTEIISSDYTIPSNRYMLMYITYEGTGAFIVDLPEFPVVGQRIYIMYGSGTGTSQIRNGSSVLEIEPSTMQSCYYNGDRWICIGQQNFSKI